MEGYKLYNCLFEDVEPCDLEDHDEISAYDENLSYNSGWYNYYEVTFRYRGKKYSMEKKVHTSDNVCDTEYLIETFQEVVAVNDLAKEIDKIISDIENQSYDTWEEIIEDLEKLKKNAEFYIIE